LKKKKGSIMKKPILFGLTTLFYTAALYSGSATQNVTINIQSGSTIAIGPFSTINPTISGGGLSGSTDPNTMTITGLSGVTSVAVTVEATAGPGTIALVDGDQIDIIASVGGVGPVSLITGGLTPEYVTGPSPLFTVNLPAETASDLTVSYFNSNEERTSGNLVTTLTFVSTAS
jgi:hypothetical protein